MRPSIARVAGLSGSITVVAALGYFLLPGGERSPGACTVASDVPQAPVRPGGGGSAVGSLAERIEMASPGATVRIEAGLHRIANPVVIRANGVRIVGRGSEETRLVPTRPGCSLLVVLGSDVVIDSLGMDLSPEGGPAGAAGIGVEIGLGVEGCRFRGLRISGAGAAGIHGAQVSRCTVEGSLIQDSGDDGIFLRGSDFVILDNTITRYFDEAVDVAGNGELVVADNRAGNGRIGIVLGGGSVIEVTGNVVTDDLQGSIHVHEGTGRVVVDSNLVSPDGGTAILVKGAPELSMVGNRARGPAAVGFVVEAVAGGVFEGNVASVGGVGYRIGDIGDTEVRGNGVCAPGPTVPVERIGEGAGGPEVEASIVEVPATDPGCADVGLPPPAMPVLAVEGDSVRARAIADSLSNYLKWVNPGYLSVGLSGDSVWTEIDRDLRDVLLAARGNSIGILRTAFLFGVRSGQPGIAFPRWHLFHEGELVAVVVPRTGGAGMVARFADEDGVIPFRGRVGLWRWMGDHHVRRFWEAVPPFWNATFWSGD